MAENGSTATTTSYPAATQPEASTQTAVNSTDKALSQGEQAPGAEPPANESAVTTADERNKSSGISNNVNKWPGWPGDCVFRLVVPVLKVGSIIGRKGELIKKMCEETRARIRVLEGPESSPDRVVLISGKEEPDEPLSPAMDAVIRLFKRITGLPETEGGSDTPGTPGNAFSSVRLLVAQTQAINLIGKHGSLIKSIQESTGSVIRVLSNEETPSYVSSDEKLVELRGESLKVLKALEAVVGHLRRFLVDHSVIPLFEKNYNVPVSEELSVGSSWPDKPLYPSTTQVGRENDYPLPVKRDSFLFDRESQLEQIPSSLSIYGQDPSLSGIRTSNYGRTSVPIVTQVTHTMQIPLRFAEVIIGDSGANIGYIRRASGAILTVQESRGLPGEITVEIKGNSSQVQIAQQLIEEFMSGHTESQRRGHVNLDSGYMPSYPQVSSSYTPQVDSYTPQVSGSYTPTSYSGQPYGSYGSTGVGGYNSFRL